MYKLKKNGQMWLKGFHLIAVCSWIGGAVSLLLIYFLKEGIDDGRVLYGINMTSHHVDTMVVVIPGAFGCLITGLIYSVFTNWGFFKHNWVIVKWVVTVSAILFGTFFLGPWETKMMDISGAIGMKSLTDPSYLYNQKMNFMFGTIQVSILIITVFISIFKPWKGRKAKVKQG